MNTVGPWRYLVKRSLVESARIAQRREHSIHAVRAWAIPRPPTSRPIRFRVPVVGGRAVGAGSGGACRPHTLPLPSLASCRRRASGSRLRSGLPPGIRVDPVTARPPPGIRALVARHRPRPPRSGGSTGLAMITPIVESARAQPDFARHGTRRCLRDSSRHHREEEGVWPPPARRLTVCPA